MIVRRENFPCLLVPWAALSILALAGCKAPTVNLSTNDPIKVDINMRLDVYQYASGGTNAAASPTPAVGGSSQPGAESRRRNRMADIQKFKNERLIGEGRSGLVVIMKDKLPEGAYGDYVRRTVERENQDRSELMKENAETQKVSLDQLQKQQAELWRNRSFKGEWIEVEVEPGNWQWQQKEG